MKHRFVLAATLISITAAAQNEPPFTSICISENSGGFSWKNGEWRHAVFKPRDKYLVRKLNMATDLPAGDITGNRALACDGMFSGAVKIGPSGQDTAKQACYSVRQYGVEEMLLIHAEKCVEIYASNERLKEVQCKQIRFSPNGPFISLPTGASVNLSQTPDGDYKDDIAIEVGRCSKM